MNATVAVSPLPHRVGRSLLVVLSLCVSLETHAHDSPPEERPNFIIILVDDLGYGDVGCYGASLIETPNIDRLAAEGIRFTSFYAQNVCGPSRAALLTGCYPIRLAEPGNRKHPHTILHPEETTLAELVKAGGYTTACVGKWHLAGQGKGEHGPGTGPYRQELMPNAQGFDYFFGTPAHNGTTRELAGWKTELYRNQRLVDRHASMDTLTKRETEEAVQFLRGHRDEPFFLYLAYNMVHVVLGASEEFRGTSPRGLYGDALREIDDGVGRLMAVLRELGLDRQTLVLFTSDNGPWIEGHLRDHGGSAYPLRGFKMSTWEGGLRVPGIVRWPGRIQAGQVRDDVVTTLDVYPTFAKLARADLPGNRRIDGLDMSDFWLGRAAQSPRDTFVYYAYTHLQAIRNGDWKLVLSRPANPPWTTWYGRMIDAVETPQLYDLNSDVAELNDVAQQYPQVAARLSAMIDAARHDLGDYNVVGHGARFFDPDPPPPGPRRPDRRTGGGGAGPYTRLSSGRSPVGSRYTPVIDREAGVTRRDPSDVIRVGDTYYVWYTKITRAPGVFAYPSGYSGDIYYATSSDGHAWSERGRALGKGGRGAWDEHGVFTPNVAAFQRKYYLLYTGVPRPFDTNTKTAIGVAVSRSPHGPWHRAGAYPILTPSDDRDAFDSMRVDDAAVVIREGRLWLYYKGRSLVHGDSGPSKTRMGVATALVPTGPYTKNRAGPLHPGHEVTVWPQSFGVGSMATAAGPSVFYYAFDGLHFTTRNQLLDPPHAPGIFREDRFRDHLIAPIPTWGVAHRADRGDLFLVRFDMVYGAKSTHTDEDK